jgi:hypothetical protein
MILAAARFIPSGIGLFQSPNAFALVLGIRALIAERAQLSHHRTSYGKLEK